MRKNRIIITGGSGFIGSHFIRFLIRNEQNSDIFNLDALTYAGDNRRLQDICKNPNYHYFKCDIGKIDTLLYYLKDIKPDIIFHFASETHVDNSIKRPSEFITTNIIGTFNILEYTRSSRAKLIHISTDEIYGDRIKGSRLFSETSNYNPSSPYSASKASQEMLIKSYIRTYSIQTIIIRPCNHFGPFQHIEKFVPKCIINAIKNKPIEIYGNGENVREWIYVEDGCEAIYIIAQKGKIGDIYNLGSSFMISNLDMAKEILRLTQRSEKLIKFIKDRPGHDILYGVNFAKLKKLGFTPKTTIKKGLEKTINWYIKNIDLFI